MSVSEEMVQLVVVPVFMLCITAVIVALRIARAIERKSLAGAVGAKGLPEQAAGLGELSHYSGRAMPSARSDVRRGVLWLCTGIGSAVFFFCAAAMSDASVKNPVLALGIGAFPIAMGIGYLILGCSALGSKN